MVIQTTSSSSLAPVKKMTSASSAGSSARSSVSSGSSGSSARSSGSGPRKRIDNTVYWSIVWRAITPRVGKVLPPLRRLSPE